MRIDIRDNPQTEIEEIIFADNEQSLTLSSLTNHIYIEDCDVFSCIRSRIKNKDIPNLIKALKKVCELKGINHE